MLIGGDQMEGCLYSLIDKRHPDKWVWFTRLNSKMNKLWYLALMLDNIKQQASFKLNYFYAFFIAYDAALHIWM